MKRRSFLQSIIGAMMVLFLPKAKADVDGIVKETLAKDPNWRDTRKHKREKIIWRRWTTLDKEPEAYTQEDIEAVSGINEEMFGDRDYSGRQMQEHCHDFGKQTLDMCKCGDYVYVLLRDGGLWRSGKPFNENWELVWINVPPTDKLVACSDCNGDRWVECRKYITGKIFCHYKFYV